MHEHDTEIEPTDDEIAASACGVTADEWVTLIVDAECEAVHDDLVAAGVL